MQRDVRAERGLPSVRHWPNQESRPWQKEPCWEVRAWHMDCSSILFTLEFLRTELCKWSCCLWGCFTPSFCERDLNLSGEASELNPAAFTKSYCVIEWSPSVRWFSRGRTPISTVWMTFAPCIKAKMSSHFLKKVTHTENTHTKMTHTSLNCHSQGCAAKRACKCHWAWFSSFLSRCDYDMCWYLLCEITTDIGHFRKCKETANHNICNIIKASIILVWA